MSHASCSVQFTERPAADRLNRLVESTQPKIDKLRRGIATKEAYVFNNSMIYKMVDSLAEYHADFRGLKEVVMDSKSMSAASKVDLTKVKLSQSQAFHAHPAYIDAFCQSAGFIMNANDNADLEREVFVNHGWDVLQLYENIEPDKLYHTWIQMMRHEGTTWRGCMTILCGSIVVGEIENITVCLQPGDP